MKQGLNTLATMAVLLILFCGIANSQSRVIFDPQDTIGGKELKHRIIVTEIIDSACKSVMLYTCGIYDREKILPELKTTIERSGYKLLFQATAPEIVGMQFNEKNLMGSSVRIFGSATDDRWTENNQSVTVDILFKKLDDSKMPKEQFTKYDKLTQQLVDDLATIFKRYEL